MESMTLYLNRYDSSVQASYQAFIYPWDPSTNATSGAAIYTGPASVAFPTNLPILTDYSPTQAVTIPFNPPVAGLQVGQ